MTSRSANAAGVRGFIREVDGLRGIAILLVICHHFWPEVGGLAHYADLGHLGWIGVDLFYVISGFLITGILLDTAGEASYYRNYLARRVLRVFPLYYLFVIGAYVLFPMAQPGPWSETEFVQQAGNPLWYLFYVGNFRDAAGFEPTYVFGPLWSLAIEEQFYLTIPFLIARARRKTLWWIFGSMLALAPLIRLGAYLVWPDLVRIQYVATPSRVDVLALGCLMALYFRSDLPLPNKRTVLTAVSAMAAAMVATFLLGGFERSDQSNWFAHIVGFSLIAFFFTTVVFATVLHRDAPGTAFLRFRPLCYLGKICYGLYLLHRPSEVVLLKVLPRLRIDPLEHPELTFALKFAFAVGVASLSWFFFEKQVLRLKRRFESARHPGHASAEALSSAGPAR